jgi:hypothetical protein
MKEKLKRLFEPEEIFIDIRETDIEISDPYKGVKVKIEDYVMLHSSTGYFKQDKDINFLGLNRVFDDLKETANNGSIDRKSFWLRNSELFACLSSIVYPWIDEKKKLSFQDPMLGFQAKDWMEKLKLKVITIEPSFNWYGFFVDLNEIQDYFSEHVVDLIKSLNEKGFTLSVLAENGLGNNNSANIYLQICANWSKQEESSVKENIINYNSLTLEKTNFKVEYGKNPSKLLQYFNDEILSISRLEDISSKYSREFISAVRNFNLLYDLMENETLNEIAYNALLLDLHDRNRNESSVDLDDRLKNLLKKTINKGHNISRGSDQPFTWAHIIESVVRNNAENISSKVEKNPYEITHLFSKKMVVQKMERIYDKISDRDDSEKERKTYIEKQVISYAEVVSYLND